MRQGERFFCALESQANREQIFGTVARIDSWLLIEYPAVWRHHAVDDSRLISSEVKEKLGRLPVDRILLVRQKHEWARELSAFVVESSGESPSIRRYTLNGYDDLLRMSGPGERVDSLMFAVCTHSRHDKCCAKFGTAVWCSMRDQIPERAWQCSHVGGDRFAGNVVVFPYGLYYGRVQPQDVPELVRRSDSGEIWLSGYRGRSAHPRPVQIADYFLRSQSGILGINAFRHLVTERNTDGLMAVTFQSRGDGSLHRIEYTTRPNALRQQLTCNSEHESDVAQYELARYTVADK